MNKLHRPHNAYPDAVVRQLNALTSAFYVREASSFSATRQSPWHGWEHAWNAIAAEDPSFADKPLTALDLGCGNLRFERFLIERNSGPLTVHAFDSCPALLGEPPANAIIEFAALDIVESLLDGTFAQHLPQGACDLTVAFGVMHHLPSFTMRAQVLEALLRALRPGGFAVVSFWQFLNDERLAAKAKVVTAQGRARHNLPSFSPGDYLLGWQDRPDVFRFCHHTTDEEIDALLAEAALMVEPTAVAPFREIARFSADGKLGDLNRYVVLRRL